jgi:hypothetical protein
MKWLLQETYYQKSEWSYWKNEHQLQKSPPLIKQNKNRMIVTHVKQQVQQNRKVHKDNKGK